jgi:aminomethyltransferase
MALKQTPLNAAHRAMGAKMVDFGGWDMPVNYGSQIDEHHQVRNDCGMFDVSHMRVVDLKGAGVRGFLRYLLANNVDKLTLPGKALYSCMLLENGGVIDDLIVYFMNEEWFRIVVNAGTADKDIAWMKQQAAQHSPELIITAHPQLAMVAVQGPNARAKVWEALPGSRELTESLIPFSAAEMGVMFIARTGYTGEDGFEIMIPAKAAPFFWASLAEKGVKPIGLGARDTLRLEAGMNLYGQDMDESINPLEAGLAWTVDLKSERDFIGKAALLVNPPTRKLYIPPTVRERSPAAVFRRPWKNPLRWRGCPKMCRSVTPCKLRFAIKCSRQKLSNIPLRATVKAVWKRKSLVKIVQ